MRAAVVAMAGAVCACLVVSGCGGAAKGSPPTLGPPTTYVKPPTRVYRVPSSAMEPTIHCAKPAPGCKATVDDEVLVRLSGSANLKRGDIIVFRTPPKAAAVCGEGGTFVKRLIGLPNETVHEDTHGLIFIRTPGAKSYFKLKEPYIQAQRRAADVTHFNKTWHVPAGRYFAVGDNRGESCDSRDWGAVPGGNIIGPVVKIIRSR